MPQTPADRHRGSRQLIQVESTRAGMRGAMRQDAEKKRRGASPIRRKRRREGESGVVWTSGEREVASGRKKRCHVASGRKERCHASQDAQDAQDAEYPPLATGRNAGGSDPRSVFADVSLPHDRFSLRVLPEHYGLPYLSTMQGHRKPGGLS